MYVAFVRLPSWKVVAPAVPAPVEVVTLALSCQHSSAELLLASVTIAVAKNASVATQVTAYCTRAKAKTPKLNNMAPFRGGLGMAGHRLRLKVHIYGLASLVYGDAGLPLRCTAFR